ATRARVHGVGHGGLPSAHLHGVRGGGGRVRGRGETRRERRDARFGEREVMPAHHRDRDGRQGAAGFRGGAGEVCQDPDVVVGVRGELVLCTEGGFDQAEGRELGGQVRGLV